MPNKIADHRKRVVYIEDKDVYEELSEYAKNFSKTGIEIKPSDLLRLATKQLIRHLRVPGAKLSFPSNIFGEQP
jgi:hypothetical protein